MIRPAAICRELLATIDASEGRRKRRSRNTTADAIGLQIKRDLLEEIVHADPAADDFEGWLLERCLAEGASDGPVRALALTVVEEWQLSRARGDWRRWLTQGVAS